MKEFHVMNGPYMKDQNSTSKMMKHLTIALLPIVLFSIFKNGIYPYVMGYATIYGMLYPIIMIFLATFTTFFMEFSYQYFFKKKRKDELKEYLKHSYSFLPGLFLALILPINTPFSIVVVGAVFASVVGKIIFGGFGHNLFNPALIGRLFVISAYALVISGKGGYLNPLELDAVTTATPLTNASLLEGIGSYQTLVAPYGNLWNFFFGFRSGCLGETSAFLCILAFFYLTFKKVIKWRIPVIYVATVFFMTYFIGSYQDLGIWYPLFEIMSGGLLFGAVFMATDPVTSPTTPIGQTLYGLFLGILTVVFRYLTPYPEGVLTSILTMNLLVVIIDRIGMKSRFHFEKAIPYFLTAWLLVFFISIGIGKSFDPSTTPDKDPNYKVLEKTKDQDKTTYIVTQKGYSSTLKGKIVIQNKKAISFEILEQQDSFYQKIETEDYIDRLLKEQDRLEEADTVSGATITSNALKKMLIHTLEEEG